jgi:hypothetical protein
LKTSDFTNRYSFFSCSLLGAIQLIIMIFAMKKYIFEYPVVARDMKNRQTITLRII